MFESSAGNKDGVVKVIPNKFRAPKGTYFEGLFQDLLTRRNISHMTSQVIAYSPWSPITPDIVLPGNMVIEVDGYAHDLLETQADDRKKEKMLQKMGYNVLRVRNEDITNSPSGVIEKVENFIITSKKFKKQTKVQPMVLSMWRDDYKILDNKQKSSASSFVKRNRLLDLNPIEFISKVEAFSRGLSKVPMDSDFLLFNDFGFSLKPSNDESVIDYENAANDFGNVIDLMGSLYGLEAKQGMKNRLIYEAPFLMKNVIIQGGPNNNKHLVRVHSLEQLKKNVESFNEAFKGIGIWVEEKEVLEECCIKVKRSGYRFQPWLREICH
ncbi:MAG: endonuclease domain-containing protein [Candidatus Thermoplasmatota archaeon]|nr:endonuclease domain-containing protein [Candidatus Thermoplasmatota archaeon]